jgi:hypothetical protein
MRKDRINSGKKDDIVLEGRTNGHRKKIVGEGVV